MIPDPLNTTSLPPQNEKSEESLPANVESKNNGNEIEVPKNILDTKSESTVNLSDKKIDSPPKSGIFAKVSRFFRRHFSSIPPTKLKIASDVEENIKNLQKHLDTADTSIKKAMSNQKKASQSKEVDYVPGNVKSLVQSQNDYAALLEAYKQAESSLRELEDHKESAIQLSQDHAKFGNLPFQINILEKKVALLKAHLEIQSQFQKLEASMKNFPKEPEWKDFSNIIESRKELAVLLQKVLKENIGLKDEVKVKKFLAEKAGKYWNGGDVYRVIYSNFPDLKYHTERLLKSGIEMQKKLIEKFDATIDQAIPFLLEYEKILKEITGWKQTIEGKTIGARFARVFYNLAGKDYMQNKLTKLQEDQQLLYSYIKRVGKDINNDEIDVLIQIEKPELGKDIKAFRDIIVYFDAQNEFNNLNKKIDCYNRTNNKESSIKKNIEKLAEIVEKNISGISFNSRSVPKNFAQLDLKDQLRVLISLSFPKIRKDNEQLFKTIVEKGLGDEVNSILQQRIGIKNKPQSISETNQTEINSQNIENKSEEIKDIEKISVSDDETKLPETSEVLKPLDIPEASLPGELEALGIPKAPPPPPPPKFEQIYINYPESKKPVGEKVLTFAEQIQNRKELKKVGLIVKEEPPPLQGIMAAVENIVEGLKLHKPVEDEDVKDVLTKSIEFEDTSEMIEKEKKQEELTRIEFEKNKKLREELEKNPPVVYKEEVRPLTKIELLKARILGTDEKKVPEVISTEPEEEEVEITSARPQDLKLQVADDVQGDARISAGLKKMRALAGGSEDSEEDEDDDSEILF